MFRIFKRRTPPPDQRVTICPRTGFQTATICPLCGDMGWWWRNHCDKCRYLEPSWNQAHVFHYGPLEAKYFAV